MKKRKIVVRVSCCVETTVPEDWNAAQIDFWLNESSMCADTLVRQAFKELRDYKRRHGCFCGGVMLEYVELVHDKSVDTDAEPV